MAQEATEDIKVTIEKLELKVLNYTLSEPLYREIVSKLEKQSLRYYFSKPDVDIYTVNYTMTHIKSGYFNFSQFL